MIDIEVMYADLSRRRVPLDQAKKNLPRDGVLFIILSYNGKRRRQVTGKDFYYLYIDGDEVHLNGWDEQDNPVVLLGAPEAKRYASRPLGLPSDTLIFTGVLLPEDEWQEARALFAREMH